MKRFYHLSLSLAVILAIASTAAFGGLLFDKSEYAARRAKLMEKIPDGIAVIRGVAMGRFQDNNFIYLTGLEIPDAILLVDGIRKESVIFFTLTETAARNEGISVDLVKTPREYTGIERALPVEQFSSYLLRTSSQAKTIFTLFGPQEVMRQPGSLQGFLSAMTLDPWDGRLTRELQFVERLKQRFPQNEVKDCSQVIWDMRKIKSPAEIDIMRKAAALGVKASTEVMRTTRPGVYEYELAALYDFFVKKTGTDELAFNTIISSAENHANVHYTRHDRLLVDGDFLVLDAGPDIGYYDTDISISFPANGKFSPRQREIYEACNEVSKTCLSLYRPGISGYEVGEKAREILKAKGYDLSKDAFTQLRFFKEGGLTHYVGLGTHDAGGRDLDYGAPLKPGCVFASDIYAIYPKENLGVRCENTVLITETGCENLSKGIPREIGEIEAFMKTDGAIQVLKDKKLY